MNILIAIAILVILTLGLVGFMLWVLGQIFGDNTSGVVDGFEKKRGSQYPDDDKIIIHLGHLSDEKYNEIVETLVGFMNKEWPDVMGVNK